MSNFTEWVNESDLAKEITVQTRIILNENYMSKAEVIASADKPLTLDKETTKKKAPFALEVGGEIVGWGRIEKRFGSHYFKLIETADERKLKNTEEHA